MIFIIFLLICTNNFIHAARLRAKLTILFPLQDVTNTHISTSEPTERQGISCNTPVPVFSMRVQASLQINDSHAVWHQMIREAADHYYSQDPSIGKENQQVYALIGKSILQKYPCLKRTGNRDWVSRKL